MYLKASYSTKQVTVWGQLFISKSSSSMVPINLGLNQLWRKIAESIKKQKLSFQLTGNYLHRIYIVLGITSKSRDDLE